jgi:glucoamylase
MPRDLPIGNGDMLVTFDDRYRARDLYFPFIGKYNHTCGHVQRFGIWADGRMAWVEEDGWERTLRYRPGTLVTDVTLKHEGLGLVVRCADCVDFEETVWLRRIVVEDLLGKPRDVRIFQHVDLSIQESPVGDTALYDPRAMGLLLYKGKYCFLLSSCDSQKCGIDHWAIGTKRIGGAEGTWRDAEDGVLGRNAISQGSVDATVGFDLPIEPGGQAYATLWLACGTDVESVRALSADIIKRTPERFISRTDSYWQLWSGKERLDLAALPAEVADLFIRSQLVVRTQVDNRGAIIAANDTDITHFAGDHYSYCWPRDGALVAHALALCGQGGLCRAFYRYCAGVIHPDGYFLHKYTPDGRLASSWHPLVVEGRGVLPIQQDETALVVWALRKHFEISRDLEFIKPLYNTLVVKPAKWMVEYRDRTTDGRLGLPQPSWDLWEERRGVHAFTTAATIGALRAAADFAEDFGDMGRARYWRKGADEILEAMREVFWDPAEKRFARMVKPVYAPNGAVERYERDMTPDSANYATFAFGAMPPDDPMVIADMAALMDKLWCKTDVGGCARYAGDYYHRVVQDDPENVPGNPWLICTLWHAQHTIARATTRQQLEPAMDLLRWAAARAALSGVLAEQFDPRSGAPISVAPLTWSHATVVTVVMEYLRRLAQLPA